MSVSDPQREMASAVLELLSNSPPVAEDDSGAVQVFDSKVDGSPTAWAVFYLQRLLNGARMTSGAAQIDWLLTVHSVGEDVFQARAISERVNQRLAPFGGPSVRLAVEGWESSPIRPVDSDGADFDRDTDPAPAFVVDQFRWRSDRRVT